MYIEVKNDPEKLFYNSLFYNRLIFDALDGGSRRHWS